MQLTINVALFALGFSCAAVASTKPRQSRDKLGLILQQVHQLLGVIRRWFGDSTIRYNARIEGDEKLLYTKSDIEQRYASDTWQRNVYEDFKETLMCKDRTFPCVYATMGFRKDEHRYVFLESQNPNEARNLRRVSRALQEYLHAAPSLGDFTSLVIVAEPPANGSGLAVEDYGEQFWNMLRGLRIADPNPWPTDTPTSTGSEHWTFCFGGEPVFPVALTPAHELRASRHAASFIVALQPKWILDKLLATDAKREAAQSKVRTLLKKYDRVHVSPDLTSYGEPGTSEARQLFLLDQNETSKIPFSDLDD